MRRLVTTMLACCTGFGVVETAAHAGGVYVPGYGSQGQPRAGAFVAKADDPSALYYNPAGFAKTTGTVIHLGINFLNLSQTFTRDGVYEATGEPTEPSYVGQQYPTVSDESSPALGIGGFQAIPLLSIATDFGQSWPVKFGFGAVAAHGYPERKYSADYTFEEPDVGPPPQRYDILEQDVFALFPSAAVAYSPTPNLDIGLRLSIGFAGLSGKSGVWGIRNYEEFVANDGVISIDVEDSWVSGRVDVGKNIPSPIFGLGALYRPAPAIELGASYRSGEHINGKGTATAVLGSALGLGSTPEMIIPETEFPRCDAGGNAATLKACIDFDLPQTFAIGGRYIFLGADGRPRGDIELDVEWEDWSGAAEFKVVVDGRSALTGLPLNDALIRHGFRDVWSVRLGGSYDIPIGRPSLQVRAGAAYDTAASPTSFTRLDIDGLARTTIGLGVALELSRFRLELGSGAVLEGNRTVDNGCNPDVDEPGCEGTGLETPQAERDAPDPAQPLQGPNNQVQNPFNDGVYEQGYILLSLGLTTWF